MNNNIVELNDNNFRQHISQEDKLVLIDFWAEWCNPCKILAPILEDISKEYKEKLIVAKVNIENSSKIASQYSIRGIPALLLFNKGELIATKIGALSKSQLKNFIDTHLK